MSPFRRKTIQDTKFTLHTLQPYHKFREINPKASSSYELHRSNTKFQKGKALPPSRANPQTTDCSLKVSTTLPSASTSRSTSAGPHGLYYSIPTTRQAKNAPVTGVVSSSFRPNVRGSEEEDPSHPRAGKTTTLVGFLTSSTRGPPFSTSATLCTSNNRCEPHRLESSLQWSYH